MRIAIVTPGFSADDDDWCIPVLQDFATSLNAAHDVRVYATCYPFDSRDYTVKGVAVRSFGDGLRGRLPWLRRQSRALSAMAADHGVAAFDIVHGFWADGGGVVSARFRQSQRTPSVVTLMGGELIFDPRSGYGKARRPIAGRLARYGARAATNLNVSSTWHRDRIREKYRHFSPEVLNLGVDVRLFNEETRPIELEGDVPILCVASLVVVKGHDAVLRAFAAATRDIPGLHLHLVGEGPLEGGLRGLLSQLGIARQVSFHGHVAHQDLPRYYRAAAFCVLGSYFENHGMVILEAAACGKVTIGSAVGSMPQFCPLDLLGMPGDVNRLAEAMRTLATDAALRYRLERHAANRVRDEYTVEHMRQAFEAAYLRQLDSNPG